MTGFFARLAHKTLKPMPFSASPSLPSAEGLDSDSLQVPLADGLQAEIRTETRGSVLNFKNQLHNESKPTSATLTKLPETKTLFDEPEYKLAEHPQISEAPDVNIIKFSNIQTTLGETNYKPAGQTELNKNLKIGSETKSKENYKQSEQTKTELILTDDKLTFNNNDETKRELIAIKQTNNPKRSDSEQKLSFDLSSAETSHKLAASHNIMKPVADIKNPMMTKTAKPLTLENAKTSSSNNTNNTVSLSGKFSTEISPTNSRQKSQQQEPQKTIKKSEKADQQEPYIDKISILQPPTTQQKLVPLGKDRGKDKIASGYAKNSSPALLSNQAPQVQINIGRMEIRSTQAKPITQKPQQRNTQRAKPKLILGDYLQHGE